MSFSKVLVLADKNNGGYPEFFGLMLLESIAYDLCLTNVSVGRVGLGITSYKNIDSWLS